MFIAGLVLEGWKIVGEGGWCGTDTGDELWSILHNILFLRALLFQLWKVVVFAFGFFLHLFKNLNTSKSITRNQSYNNKTNSKPELHRRTNFNSLFSKSSALALTCSSLPIKFCPPIQMSSQGWAGTKCSPQSHLADNIWLSHTRAALVHLRSPIFSSKKIKTKQKRKVLISFLEDQCRLEEILPCIVTVPKALKQTLCSAVAVSFTWLPWKRIRLYISVRWIRHVWNTEIFFKSGKSKR